MTKTQVEVITSVQRRRRWSRSEKERIAAAAMESGAVASEVARAAGIHTSQLFRWRQRLCEREQFLAAFNPVAVVSEPGVGIARTDAEEGWRHRHRVRATQGPALCQIVFTE
jgi:transposase-like protein